MASIINKFTNRFFTKKWFFVFVVCLIVAAVVYLQTKPKDAISKSGAPLKKYTVVRRDLENVVSLSGTVDADEKVVLQFQSSGKLVWVGVKEGDTVVKGQAIASLDQRSLRKNLEKDLRDFSTQRLTVDQFRADNKTQNTGGDNSYLTDQLTRLAQENQNGLDKSVLDVELDNLSLELSNLITPIDGIVTQVDQSVAGVNITPATARFSIVNPDSLYLLGTVDQQDIAKIQQGAQAKIIFDAFPDTTYLGNVTYIAFSPDSGDNNSYSIKLSVPNNIAKSLRLAMGAEATIVTDTRKHVMAVPVEAVTDENGSKSVSVLTGTLQTKRVIKTGLETDDYVQVTQGLYVNDVVVY